MVVAYSHQFVGRLSARVWRGNTWIALLTDIMRFGSVPKRLPSYADCIAVVEIANRREAGSFVDSRSKAFVLANREDASWISVASGNDAYEAVPYAVCGPGSATVRLAVC